MKLCDDLAMSERRWYKPELMRGVWVTPTFGETLCRLCSKAEVRPNGALACTADPQRLAVAHACRDYEREAGADDECV